MAKITSGVLCRDIGGSEFICFYPDIEMVLGIYGFWRDKSRGRLVKLLGEWNAEYQLYNESGKKIPPPAPGKCFEVEIEL